ncbi:TPA: TIGR00270 family protein [Candidatus Woesearchaeota archaeon]|nr:TIGR00270 family protein [Candidatus Woesearchaeota archaeon]
MDCEMCGRQEAEVRASVEGSVLAVCQGCGRYGKVVGRIAAAAPARKDERRMPMADEEAEVVVSDFGNALKQKRERLGMKQDEFSRKIAVKESILHKMETSQFVPSIEEARRLGKALGLKFVEKAEIDDNAVPQPKKDELTLGDLIKIKRR